MNDLVFAFNIVEETNKSTQLLLKLNTFVILMIKIRKLFAFLVTLNIEFHFYSLKSQIETNIESNYFREKKWHCRYLGKLNRTYIKGVFYTYGIQRKSQICNPINRHGICTCLMFEAVRWKGKVSQHCQPYPNALYLLTKTNEFWLDLRQKSPAKQSLAIKRWSKKNKNRKDFLLLDILILFVGGKETELEHQWK